MEFNVLSVFKGIEKEPINPFNPNEVGTSLFLNGGMGQKIKENMEKQAKKAGMDRRNFFRSSIGLSAAMLAANQASGLLLGPQLAPLLERQVQQATNLLDLELPAPQLRWRERNWLLGVQQRLEFEWDLRPLDSLPGLELRLHLQPLKLAAVRTALPAAAQVEASETVGWSLQAGALNQLALGCWRWSGLGLGALGVALLLGLSLLLQWLEARA
jgi:hypothetical protein